MAKEKIAFTLYDDEPNLFAMSEEEYEIAYDEYNKKIEAEHAKMEALIKSQNKKTNA